MTTDTQQQSGGAVTSKDGLSGRDRNANDLEMTEKLFSFLQGKDKHGCTIKRKEMPRLTADQAWTVIWWLGNQYWQVTDHVERCEVCGELFDTWNSGDCLDYGKAPYHFCDSCMSGEEYGRKAASKLNPDNESSSPIRAGRDGEAERKR